MNSENNCSTFAPLVAGQNSVIICDLDNCLSDDRWRRHLIDKSLTGEDRYFRYNALAHLDQANKQLLAFLHNWTGDIERHLLFITARPASRRQETIAWLHENGLWKFRLFMRPEGNLDTSPILKTAIVQSIFDDGTLRDKNQIATIIDDRRDVLEALDKATGRPTLLINLDNFLEMRRELTAFFELRKEPGRNFFLEACNLLQKEGLMDLPQKVAQEVALFFSEGNAGKDRAAESTSATAPVAKRTVGERVAQLMEEGAKTFRERNASYGSNFRMVGPVMQQLFPNGVPPELLRHDAFHLFELVVVKLSRFAISKFTHEDSIHDAMVYCAMIEAIIQELKEK